MSAPLARFVAQNYRDLTFPYKRYTYGDVFRRESLTVQDIDLSCSLMQILLEM